MAARALSDQPFIYQGFQFPSFHSFPPMYTRQPVLETRQQQEKLWTELILSFCRHFKFYVLDIDEAIASWPLFKHERNQRQLEREHILELLEKLESQGNLEWIDKKTKRQARIIWRTPEQWGNLIYEWAVKTGHLNTVITVWDLREGDDCLDQEWHGLELEIFLDALKTLEVQKKAMVFTGTETDSRGVKFFQA